VWLILKNSTELFISHKHKTNILPKEQDAKYNYGRSYIKTTFNKNVMQEKTNMLNLLYRMELGITGLSNSQK
jgi:hypothetical protein